MNDINNMDYAGEEIQFGGKTRHILFAATGLKLIAKKYGSVIDGFNKMRTMDPKFTEETIDDMVMLLQAGLIHEDDTLTPKQIESWLTIQNMNPLFNIMVAAFIMSAPEAKEGSESNPGETLTST